MAYTKIRSLPDNINVTASGSTPDELVIEQDVTRKITPLTFIQQSVPQLSLTTTINSGDLIPISHSSITNNITISTLKDYIHQQAAIHNEVFYVSKNGVDFEENNPSRGRNPDAPFLTIKRAVKAVCDELYGNPADPNYNNNDGNNGTDAGGVDFSPSSTNKQYTIFVRSGDYTEQNPIYLPPNTSLIGDNIRRTTIRPANPLYDILWVSSACYIWGFTFRGHKSIVNTTTNPNTQTYTSESAAVAFPVTSNTSQYATYLYNVSDQIAQAYSYGQYTLPYAAVPTGRPTIYVSPYIQGCTSYSIPTNSDGSSALNQVDRESIDPSTGQYGSGANNAGLGMRIDGNLVAGNIRSMVLDSYTQMNQGGRGIYLLNHGYAQLVSIFTVATREGVICESGGHCSISTSNCTFGLSGLVARGMSLSPVLSGQLISGGNGTKNILVTKPTSVPYYGQNVCFYPRTNLAFQISGTAGFIKEQDINPNATLNNTKNFFVNITPTANYSSTITTLVTSYTITLDNYINADFTQIVKNGSPFDYTNASVLFYERSSIETGSHTFEYMGAGTRMYYAIPANGGIANNNNEVVFDGLFDNNNPGIIYYTSTNELGNFNVGPDFKIVQSTGTIEGNTFKRAIITLVTPLNLILE